MANITKTKKPLVSIVITNYNGKNLLKTILTSIKKLSFKEYEVIVVDNNSKDGSQIFIKKKYKNVKLIQNSKNLGYTGINTALKYCKGKYILFLNNDMEVDEDCISHLVKTIETDEHIAMVTPKLINFYNNKLKSGGTWASRAFYTGHIKDKNKDVINETPYLGVGLIRKDFVVMFGYLFDPDYFIYAEDFDLGLRIRLNAKKILFNPYAILYHMHAVTSGKTSKGFNTFLMERNLLITFFKIFSFKNIVLYFPYVFGMRVFAIAKDIISLNFNIAFSRIRAILWVVLHFNFIYKKRKNTQKYRKAKDSYILRVFSEKYLFKKKFIV